MQKTGVEVGLLRRPQRVPAANLSHTSPQQHLTLKARMRGLISQRKSRGEEPRKKTKWILAKKTGER